MLELTRLMRRIHDAEVTRARLRQKIAADPGSNKVPIMERRAGELDLAIQQWMMDLESLEVKG